MNVASKVVNLKSLLKTLRFRVANDDAFPYPHNDHTLSNKTYPNYPQYNNDRFRKITLNDETIRNLFSTLDA